MASPPLGSQHVPFILDLGLDDRKNATHTPVHISLERSTTTAQAHNLTKCPLYQLPEEILCIIISEFSSTTSACFTLTCQRFRRLTAKFARPNRAVGAASDALELNLLLLKDLYCKPCRENFKAPAPGRWKNPQITALLPSKFCNGCATYHDPAFFSQEQLDAEPLSNGLDARICLGMQGHVRLCDHKTIHLAELLPSRPVPWKHVSRTEPAIYCSHQSHFPTDQLISFKTAPYLFPQVAWLSDTTVEITAISTVFRCPATFQTTKPKFEAALQQWSRTTSAYICPHIPTNSPRLAHLYHSIDCRHHDLSSTGHSGPTSIPAHCDSTPSRCYTPPAHQRLCPSCETTVDFFRWPSPADEKVHEIVLLVRRTITVPLDTNAAAWGWFCALEKDSYQPSLRAKHSLWCEDKQCRLTDGVMVGRPPFEILCWRQIPPREKGWDRVWDISNQVYADVNLSSLFGD